MYINKHLQAEIDKRLQQIERDKLYFGDMYKDYGMLLCLPDGRPIERSRLQRWFSDWQREKNIEPKIDMHGLRKSGAMYKLRLSNFDYQAVQRDTGHSTPTVLMEHYNEVLDPERQQLADQFESDFYLTSPTVESDKELNVDELVTQLSSDP